MSRWWIVVGLAVGWAGASARAGAAGPGEPPVPAPSPPPGAVLPGTPVPVNPGAQVGPGGAPLFAVPPPPGAGGIPGGPGGGPPPFGPFAPPRNAFDPAVPQDITNGFDCDVPPPAAITTHVHIGMEYLQWWLRQPRTPPLVTTGSLNDAVPGALGQPNTVVLLDRPDQGQSHPGARVTGIWEFGEGGAWAVDASGFWLSLTTGRQTFGGDGSPGSPVITRPFFNANTGTQDADPVNLPGIQSGALTVYAPTRMYGADANLRWTPFLSRATGTAFTFLAGYRFLSLDDKLIFDESIGGAPGSVGSTVFALQDNFTAYNRFYGGQVGGEYDCCFGCFVVQAIGKVAFGTNQQRLRISGFTTATAADGTVTVNPQAGLFAGPGNVGRFSNSDFSIVPEGQLNLGIDFNRNVRLTMGYNVLYWTRVARAGNQINPDVNVQPVGGPPIPPLQPTFNGFQTQALWVQGFDVGLWFSF
jgi:hypothetical protein